MQVFYASAVIFDMDGVITDTMPYHFNAWAEIFKKEDISVSFNDIYTREGQKGIDSVREIFKEYGKKFNESHARQLLKDKEILFKEIFKKKFIKGSRPYIKKLAQQGYRLALVTGSARHEAHQLLKDSLWDLFDVTVCGCDVQNGKPHPEPYLKAVDALKINSSDLLVVENAPFGIRSAKAAGLTCIAIETSLPKRFLSQADRVINSYDQLNKLVKFKKPIHA